MLHLILLIICSLEKSDSTKFSLSIIPANQPVLIGQKVILRCQIQGIRLSTKYAVLFRHKETVISEKCFVYQAQKFHLICEPNDWQIAETYELHIKSVSWADRGDWSCIYAANKTKQTLEVYAPAKLEKMGVSSLTSLPVTNKESMIKDSSSPSELSSSSSLATAGLDSALSIIGTPPSQYIGLGTRTNPYDLRSGLGIQLTCATTCGHPRANITWLVMNETMTKAIMPTNPNIIHENVCSNSPNTIDMTTTESNLHVHCSQLDIIGLNQVQCSVNGPQYKDTLLTRNVYILCADKNELENLKQLQKHQITTNEIKKERVRRRGERPMHLTSGEVVGIAVGSALGLILVFIGCIILRNNGKSSPLPFHGHIPGQRV
ncbi:hypothetical protein Smp_083480 [Schistosoma mansoni]|uniref:Ig-like domain-containing protein n=1 Tax=Schistosoma mansoni TaxID=6183 RepID=G4LXJ8_SCHMA|nr:hypothetical protein Smp_083480 [Schistosoma mansoni]|eukprot:XP_018645987.1 hypothetical protein Smp_083480 [Schistosoma mansoni]